MLYLKCHKCRVQVKHFVAMNQLGTIPGGFGLDEISDLHESFHFAEKMRLPAGVPHNPESYVHY